MLNNNIMELVIWTWPLGIILISAIGLIFYLRDYIRVLIALEIFMLGNVILLIALVKISPTSNLLIAEPVSAISTVPVLLAVAAAEAVVGLAVLVLLFRRRGSIAAKSTKTRLK